MPSVYKEVDKETGESEWILKVRLEPHARALCYASDWIPRALVSACS